MSRQESFEAWWALQNDVPTETMAQYRCDDERVYRLPKIANRYRAYVAGWEESSQSGYTAADMASAAADGFRDGASSRDQEVADLCDRLAELVSSVRSINSGPRHAIKHGDDDEPCYPQRKEWVEWVLGLCDDAMANCRQLEPPSKVEHGPVRADHWCLICGPSVDHGGLACPKTHAYSNN